jgi:hypothetical protein
LPIAAGADLERRMADFPVDISMQRLPLRLRCRGCGKPPASAAIDDAVPGSSRRVVRIKGRGVSGEASLFGEE